jgi:DNA-directed RNA polymerase subunit RPC12/RpoP
MLSNYTSFRCESCKKEIILLSEEVEQAINHNKYLTCVYCNSRNLKKLSETYDLRLCFENSEQRR